MNAVLTMGTRSFQLEDLLWGLKQAKLEDAATRKALGAGTQLLKSGFSARKATEFSQYVCDWGRGQRVYANLKRHNDSTLGERLAKALEQSSAADDDKSAIVPLIDIKGLNTSFASKHLRMLHPDRFGVLDTRYEEYLGFALNAAGYDFFMAELRKLEENFKYVAPDEYRNLPIGAIESGLFFLVQPRGRNQLARERAEVAALDLSSPPSNGVG